MANQKDLQYAAPSEEFHFTTFFGFNTYISNGDSTVKSVSFEGRSSYAKLIFLLILKRTILLEGVLCVFTKRLVLVEELRMLHFTIVLPYVRSCVFPSCVNFFIALCAICVELSMSNYSR